MKTLLTMTLLIATVQASALTKNSTWEDINSALNVSIKAPTISFNAGAAVAYISIFDVCTANNEIETVLPMNVYEHTMINNQHALKIVDKKVLTQPLTYTHTVYKKSIGSTSGEVVAVEVTENIALDYNVDVYSHVTGTSHDDLKLFTKGYSIPVCQ